MLSNYNDRLTSKQLIPSQMVSPSVIWTDIQMNRQTDQQAVSDYRSVSQKGADRRQ